MRREAEKAMRHEAEARREAEEVVCALYAELVDERERDDKLERMRADELEHKRARMADERERRELLNAIKDLDVYPYYNSFSDR